MTPDEIFKQRLKTEPALKAFVEKRVVRMLKQKLAASKPEKRTPALEFDDALANLAQQVDGHSREVQETRLAEMLSNFGVACCERYTREQLLTRHFFSWQDRPQRNVAVIDQPLQTKKIKLNTLAIIGYRFECPKCLELVIDPADWFMTPVEGEPLCARCHRAAV